MNALPSFGTKIPNGEHVPCPKRIETNVAGNDDDDPRTTGCTASGFCFGLGHLQCGGYNPSYAIPFDGTNNETETEQNIFQLNVFGEDWRTNGFLWTKELCEIDSDGDGFTNGEELGDPCCVWSTDIGNKHEIHPLLLNNKPEFVPSHPGLKDQIPKGVWDNEEDKAAFCSSYSWDETTAEEDGAATGAATTGQDKIPPIAEDKIYFNEGEPQESFELRTKPYPIPIRTTTYVDFIFNLPENLPDMMHIVHAEALVSQPDHLHHFVLIGCTARVDADQEGVPLERGRSTDCSMDLGGWAPGSNVFGEMSLDTGFALGAGLKIVALMFNVHYTDGVYADPETKTPKMATDGMRFYYTTKFRPYTSVGKSLIWVPSGPAPLSVPANESRYFLSRTCKVGTSCRDVSPKQFTPKQLKLFSNLMGLVETGNGSDNGSDSMLENFSCPMVLPFCFAPGVGPWAQRLCPATCGLCGSEDNPRNPDEYRISSIHYHAHLLGSEMYATLLQKQVQGPQSVEARMVAKDLKSREIWHYDDQAAIPMDYDVLVSNTDASNAETTGTLSDFAEGNTITTASTTLRRGVEVKPGDKIQVSCVFDSTARTEPTKFGQSTYDEMCITTVWLTFPTPKALASEEEDASTFATKIDLGVELELRSFQCEVDNELHTTDVYQGFLTESEDGRNIWFEHPIEDTEMCTFPVADLIIHDSVLTYDVRNCANNYENGGSDGVEEQELCWGFDNDESSTLKVKMAEDSIAGYTCYGGLYNEMSGNKEFDNVSREMCLDEGGGSDYEPYTCLDAQTWMQTQSEESPDVMAYVRTTWQATCCSLVSADTVKIKESEAADEDNDEPEVEKASSLESPSSANNPRLFYVHEGETLKLLLVLAVSTVVAITF